MDKKDQDKITQELNAMAQDKARRAVERIAKALKPEEPKPKSELARLRVEFCPPDPLNPCRCLWLKKHDEDEGFDAITVEIRERYKTSGLSGDEWRFTIIARLWWKGIQVGQSRFSSLEDATRYMDAWIHYDQMELKDDDDRKIHWPTDEQRAMYCFQPGCKELAVSTYRIKKEYGPRGEDLAEKDYDLGPRIRRFCMKHLCRGDCGLEDADRNYEVLEGPGPDKANWAGANITESQFGGVIQM